MCLGMFSDIMVSHTSDFLSHTLMYLVIYSSINTPDHVSKLACGWCLHLIPRVRMGPLPSLIGVLVYWYYGD